MNQFDPNHCRKGHPLERRPSMFYWRGRHFHGLVCAACNSLYDDPTDSFEEHVGLKGMKETRPGDAFVDSVTAAAQPSPQPPTPAEATAPPRR